MTIEQFFAPQQWIAFWKKASDDQIERMASMSEEWSKLENKGFAQWTSALEEMAKLGKESLTYGGTVSAEWRKIYVDAVKKNAKVPAAVE